MTTALDLDLNKLKARAFDKAEWAGPPSPGYTAHVSSDATTTATPQFEAAAFAANRLEPGSDPSDPTSASFSLACVEKVQHGKNCLRTLIANWNLFVKSKTGKSRAYKSGRFT
jgi:hypothetical protein